MVWVLLHAFKVYDERVAKTEKSSCCDHEVVVEPVCDQVARLLVEVNNSVVRNQELPQSTSTLVTGILLGLLAVETVALLWCLSCRWAELRRTTSGDEAVPRSAPASLSDRPRRRGGGVLQ